MSTLIKLIGVCLMSDAYEQFLTCLKFTTALMREDADSSTILESGDINDNCMDKMTFLITEAIIQRM